MHEGTDRIEADLAGGMSDEVVVDRVRAGHVELFEILVRRHNRRVYRTARAILANDDDAEDVMQEAYVRAYAHLAEFEGRARFSTWLTRIAVHEALARRRRRTRFETVDPTALEDSSVATNPNSRNPEQGVSDHELARVLEKAIDTLPEAFRTVFVLRDVEEMSVAETAECLEIPQETVKTRLFRARRLLRERLISLGAAAAPQAFEFHLSRCDRVVSAVMNRIAALPSRSS